jgi:hypothetical protein
MIANRKLKKAIGSSLPCGRGSVSACAGDSACFR